jgi:hypothetical protein
MVNHVMQHHPVPAARGLNNGRDGIANFHEIRLQCLQSRQLVWLWGESNNKFIFHI